MENQERVQQMIANIQEVIITNYIYNPKYQERYNKTTLENFREIINAKTQLVLNQMEFVDINKALSIVLDLEEGNL